MLLCSPCILPCVRQTRCTCHRSSWNPYPLLPHAGPSTGETKSQLLLVTIQQNCYNHLGCIAAIIMAGAIYCQFWRLERTRARALALHRKPKWPCMLSKASLKQRVSTLSYLNKKGLWQAMRGRFQPNRQDGKIKKTTNNDNPPSGGKKKAKKRGEEDSNVHTPRLAIPSIAPVVDGRVANGGNHGPQVGGVDGARGNRLAPHAGPLRLLAHHGPVDVVAPAMLVVAHLQDDVVVAAPVQEDGPVAGIPLVGGPVHGNVHGHTSGGRGRGSRGGS